MKHPLLKSLFLPAVCCCLSANAESTPDYTFRYGPFVAGEEASVILDFLPSRFSDATHFFLDAQDKTDPSWRQITTTAIRLLPRGKNGKKVGRATIPGKNLKKNRNITVVFGLCKGAYYSGMNYFDMALHVEDVMSVHPSQGLIVFQGDESYECDREIAVYDPRIDPDRITYHKDGYFLEGFHYGKDVNSRQVPLDLLELYYVNDVGSPSTSMLAELRFSTFASDFSGVATFHGGYVSIPLSVRCREVRDGLYSYEFLGAQNTIYYSRIDYRMFAEEPNEPYFASTDIYLPLREGHDGERYRYQIALKGAGEGKDEILISDSAISSKALFGPCQSAEYCVIIGG